MRPTGQEDIQQPERDRHLPRTGTNPRPCSANADDSPETYRVLMICPAPVRLKSRTVIGRQHSPASDERVHSGKASVYFTSVMLRISLKPSVRRR
jgi:hypothetical protein